MSLLDSAKNFFRVKKLNSTETKSSTSDSSIPVHAEIGSGTFTGEREILHVVLADLFDFIPPVVITDMKRFRDDAGRSDTFPVKKIDGPNIETYIQQAGYTQSMSAVRQAVSELHAFLSRGMSAGERTTGHMLVDKNGKVWQIDLEGAYDFVLGRFIGSIESLHIDFNSPERLAKVKTDEVQSDIEFVKKQFAFLVSRLIQSVYDRYSGERDFNEKAWKKSIFGKYLESNNWTDKEDFENTYSLEEIGKALAQLV